MQTTAASGLHGAQRKALRASRNATRQVTKAEGKLSVSDLKKSDLEGKRVSGAYMLLSAVLTSSYT